MVVFFNRLTGVALLIFSKVFKKDKIVLTTENSDVSKKVTDLLEELYMPIIEKENIPEPAQNNLQFPSE